MNMSRVLVDEADEAFLARIHLRFYLDDDSTRNWANPPRIIGSWQDVFRAFILDRNGSTEAVGRLVMCVLLIDADDAGRVPIELNDLKSRTSINSKKTLQNALYALEKDGWICRGSGDEDWLEPRMVDRAKRIYANLALAAGYKVEIDNKIGTISAINHHAVIAGQTSSGLAEPRRTFEARTFFVCLDKTS